MVNKLTQTTIKQWNSKFKTIPAYQTLSHFLFQYVLFLADSIFIDSVFLNGFRYSFIFQGFTRARVSSFITGSKKAKQKLSSPIWFEFFFAKKKILEYYFCCCYFLNLFYPHWIELKFLVKKKKQPLITALMT